MLLSTLPELPGQTFEVRGLVSAQGVLRAIGGDKVDALMRELTVQAEALGANGIVDVRAVVAGDTPHCIVLGTAVHIL
jgi:uncharacterized protein YbjQ (UPF0145 family)